MFCICFLQYIKYGKCNSSLKCKFISQWRESISITLPLNHHEKDKKFNFQAQAFVSFCTINASSTFYYVYFTFSHVIEKKLLSKIMNVTIKVIILLTYFNPMLHFYAPWKRQKTFGFLTFSEGIVMENWTNKMGRFKKILKT